MRRIAAVIAVGAAAFVTLHELGRRWVATPDDGPEHAARHRTPRRGPTVLRRPPKRGAPHRHQH